ncbi:hypothetical protein GF327_03750 [Candidatus Woesearchaeota archaeon]|nr:hypothetical protein [Candidatus Woesearchaeota archaeon]
MTPISYPPSHRTFGIELEFFLIDNEGRIVNKADSVLEEFKKNLTNTELKKECGKNMLEIATFPHLSSRHVFSNFFDDFENLIYDIDKQDLSLFYYGSYPGKNSPEMREEPRYYAKEKILGKENWKTAGRCIGFHYHYSLPRRTFNRNIKFFYPDIKERDKHKVLNVNNLFIALDPAITTFMQSSPYYQGNYLGKDSRIIAYRGEEFFEYENSLYARQPDFGTLNKYSLEFNELKNSIRKRSTEWKKLLNEHDVSFNKFTKYGTSILDSSWKPVKVTAHGTIESRGCDMNSVKKVAGLCGILKNFIRYINKNKIKIIPDKIGNKNPFKLESDKLYVPQADYLRNVLQKKSAVKGLDSMKIREYCGSLVDFLDKNVIDNNKLILQEFKEILEKRKTTSDEILDYVKKKQGYTNYKRITQETAEELSIKLSDKLFKNLLITRKMSEKSVF